jgi:hypothetical protein
VVEEKKAMSNKTIDVKEEVVAAKPEEKKSQRQLDIERARKNRVPPGIPSTSLDYPVREGYNRRIVCDRHGRLDKFLAGGWSYVQQDALEENPTGTLKATAREGIDSRVSQVVGSHKDNRPMTGYLMEIPDVLYDEDQVVKMEHIDNLEAGLKQGADADGGASPGRDGRYVPSTGIKIEQKGRPQGR